jgi:hypothetical protein
MLIPDFASLHPGYIYSACAEVPERLAAQVLDTMIEMDANARAA